MAGQDFPRRRSALTPTNTNSPAAQSGYGNTYANRLTQARFFGSPTEVEAAPPPAETLIRVNWIKVSGVAVAGGTPFGLATETDTSLALSGLQKSAVGLAVEAVTSLGLSGKQIGSFGLSSSSETAFALSGTLRGSYGLAQESDVAFGLSGKVIGAFGLAQETNSVLGLGGVLQGTYGLSVETDTAFALEAPLSGGFGVALESDTALSLSGKLVGSMGLAIEVDTALGLSGVISGPPGIASESDSALGLSGKLLGVYGVASETDTAFALAVGTVTALPYGLAIETDTALALSQPVIESGEDADAAISRRPRVVVRVKNTIKKGLKEEVEGWLRDIVGRSEVKKLPLPEVKIRSEVRETSSKTELAQADLELKKVRALIKELKFPEPIIRPVQYIPSAQEVQAAYIEAQNVIALQLLMAEYESWD